MSSMNALEDLQAQNSALWVARDELAHQVCDCAAKLQLRSVEQLNLMCVFLG